MLFCWAAPESIFDSAFEPRGTLGLAEPFFTNYRHEKAIVCYGSTAIAWSVRTEREREGLVGDSVRAGWSRSLSISG